MTPKYSTKMEIILSIIQETNNNIRERELEHTYEIFEHDQLCGFSLRHVLTGEPIKLVFDEQSSAISYAVRNGWTLQ